MVDVSINWTLPIQILNFLVLVFALNHFLYKPVRRILAERRGLFDSLEKGAAEARREIEAGEERREKQRVELLAEGASVLAKFKEEGLARERELLDRTKNEAEARIEEARSRLGAQTEDARAQLRLDAQALARTMVERILGRQLGPIN